MCSLMQIQEMKQTEKKNNSKQQHSVNNNKNSSLRRWRYYVGARLKFWRRSRVPKKGSSP